MWIHTIFLKSSEIAPGVNREQFRCILKNLGEVPISTSAENVLLMQINKLTFCDVPIYHFLRLFLFLQKPSIERARLQN